MSRPIRILLFVAGAAVALVLGAAVVLPRLLDVNRYRPLLTGQIEAATGRKVDVGSLTFGLLPSPHLSAGPIRVASARRPDQVTDLMIEGLSIRVAILPLLRGRIVVRSFRLDRPAVALHRDSRGRWNFDDLVARAAAPAGEAAPGGAAAGFSIAVEQAAIREGRILIYDDHLVRGRRLKLEVAPIDATVEGWGHGAETRLDLEAGIGGSRLRARARLADQQGRPTLGLNLSSRGLRAEDVALVLPWTGVVQPAGLEVGGRVDIQGEAVLPLQSPESLRFSGTLTLADLRYRDAGMTHAIEGIAGVVTVDGQKASLKDFAVRVGDSSLTGSLEVEDFLRPRVRFDLASPRLDFNQILALFATAAPGGGAAGGAPGSAAGAAPAAPPASGGADPAAGLIRQISGTGRFDLKAVRFQTFDLANVTAAVSMIDGTLRLRDLQGGFYGGRLGGAADLELGGPVPGYGLRIALEGVDVEPLLAAYNPELRGLLRGRLTGGLDLAAAGVAMDPILDSVRGDGSLEIRDGVLTSFSVLRQIAALLEVAGGKGIGREETPFEYLRGTLAIGDRKARTTDLALHSADLDLDGNGWVGLDATLDLNAAARFSEASTQGMVDKHGSLARLVDAGRLAVHFNLNGSLASPGFRLDTRATTRQAVSGAKERAEKRLLDRIRGKFLDQVGKEAPPAEEPQVDAPPGEEAEPPAGSGPAGEPSPKPPDGRR
jgi:AsmA protein